jgi:nickel/cobalt transporter (NicO) family protein
MSYGPQLLLIGAVAAVGVLHTIVPDHWVPITLLARQRGWSRRETARASLQAGTGHVLSTLLIAMIVWAAGVAVAQRFGHVVDTASSLALVAFGGWIAVSAWREMRSESGHSHSHGHLHGHDFAPGAIHGPERQHIPLGEGGLDLSIFEAGVPPRFRLSGIATASVKAETRREDGTRQIFLFANHGTYWESVEEIPEPHQFRVTLTVEQGGMVRRAETEFREHAHGPVGHAHAHGDHDAPAPERDPLYAPLRGDTALLTRHFHVHRHGQTTLHAHWHDHAPASSHAVAAASDAAPPLHQHRHKTTARTALLLILGSSPMVEGIPAFFAAGRYGIGLIAIMAAVFALSTIATYVLLCVSSTAGLARVSLGPFERYGEVLSGGFIALVGVAFWLWPVM